jgi:hypothetical protein
MEEVQERIQELLSENPRVVLISFGQHGGIKVEGFSPDSEGNNIPYNIPFKNLDMVVKFLDTLKNQGSKTDLEKPVVKKPAKAKVRKNNGGFSSMNKESFKNKDTCK